MSPFRNGIDDDTIDDDTIDASGNQKSAYYHLVMFGRNLHNRHYWAPMHPKWAINRHVINWMPIRMAMLFGSIWMMVMPLWCIVLPIAPLTHSDSPEWLRFWSLGWAANPHVRIQSECSLNLHSPWSSKLMALRSHYDANKAPKM